MKLDIVSPAARTIEAVQHLAAMQGSEVGQAVLRKPGEPLDAFLRQLASEVLVIEASCADAADLAAIEALTAERRGVAVLMLSEVRGSEDVIASMRAGVREVLNPALKASEFVQALERIARRGLMHAPHGTIVTFIPCKGGSGATFLAANFAHLLATGAGRRTALIDLDLEHADASYLVAGKPGKSTIVDVARQVDRLDGQLLISSMLSLAPRLAMLPAPGETEAALSMTAAQLERVLEVARETFEFVVLDMQRTFDAVAVAALDRSDVIFAVMENMIPDIRDAKRLVATLRSLGYPDSRLRLTINRQERKGVATLDEIAQAVGLKVRHVVPNAWHDASESSNLGVPLADVNPRSPVVHALRTIVDELVATAPRPDAVQPAGHAAAIRTA